jgi:hypothetical protein
LKEGEHLVAINTGIKKLDRILKNAIEDSLATDYFKDFMSCDTAILSPKSSVDVPIKDALLQLRKENKRIIFLLGEKDEEYLNYLLMLNIYDIITNPIKPDKIISVLNNPMKITDVIEIYPEISNVDKFLKETENSDTNNFATNKGKISLKPETDLIKEKEEKITPEYMQLLKQIENMKKKIEEGEKRIKELEENKKGIDKETEKAERKAESPMEEFISKSEEEFIKQFKPDIFKKKEIIAVWSVKGGVGKTTLVKNLAESIDKKVLIIDLNFYDGRADLSHMLNLPVIPLCFAIIKYKLLKKIFATSVIP